MHPHQDDNLVVLYGTRVVDIYTRAHGKVENFVVTPHQIQKNGNVIYDERPCSSGLAECFIVDLDTVTGKFRVIREGSIDQT